MRKEQGQAGLSRRELIKWLGAFSLAFSTDPLKVITAVAGGIDNPAKKEAVYIPKNSPAEQYRQKYTFSCEVASVKIVLFHYQGLFNPSEEELQDQLGTNPNPDLGFRGNYAAFSSNNLENYGAHAPAIKTLVENYGNEEFFQARILYDLEQVKDALSKDHLVLLWVPVGLASSYLKPVTLDNGKFFNLVPGEHVVVTHGFDQNGFFIYDPSPTEYHFNYAESDLLAKRMSLFEYPALEIEPRF